MANPDPEPDQLARPLTEKQVEILVKLATDGAGRWVRSHRVRGMDLEDLANEVNVRVLRYLQNWKEPGLWDNEARLRKFMTGMISRTGRDLLLHKRDSTAAQLPTLRDPSDPIGSLDSALDIQAAFRSLPRHEAEILQLTAEGFSIREIAGRQGMPEAATRMRIVRAKTELLKALRGRTTPKPRSTPAGAKPAVPEPAHELEAIELYLEPGDASEREVRAVLRALNDLHTASGGLGLEFRIDGTFVRAREGMPA